MKQSNRSFLKLVKDIFIAGENIKTNLEFRWILIHKRTLTCSNSIFRFGFQRLREPMPWPIINILTDEPKKSAS
jgi:hypothetical protein